MFVIRFCPITINAKTFQGKIVKTNKLYFVMVLAGWLMMPITPVAATVITIDYEVTGLDSLYYSNWGHAYNVSGAGNQYDALGRGVAAGHVDYSFSSGQLLDVAAWSCVVDAATSCTSPNGYSGQFRGLDVYSLIGIWSTSESSIDAVGDAFVVGSSINLVAPSVIGSLYLYLAENDGIFADNYAHDHYHVSITTQSPSAVPAPAALWLFCSGLLGMFVFPNRQLKV